jgi:hypothetical protein
MLHVLAWIFVLDGGYVVHALEQGYSWDTFFPEVISRF